MTPEEEYEAAVERALAVVTAAVSQTNLRKLAEVLVSFQIRIAALEAK